MSYHDKNTPSADSQGEKSVEYKVTPDSLDDTLDNNIIVDSEKPLIISSEEEDRISAVKLVNKRLESGVSEITKKASVVKKTQYKLKNFKSSKLRTSFRSDGIEMIPNEGPRHCFSIHKIMFDGIWYTPLHSWAGAELTNSTGPLYNADQPGSAWAIANPGVTFPKFGPFFISNFGPSFPSAPMNTNAWQNAMSSSPWPESGINMDNFYDWITNESGNTGNNPMADCDYVTILEDGPAYALASSVDGSFPDKPIQAWCLQYHGRHHRGPLGNMQFPFPSPGFNACTDVQGYIVTHTLLDAGHNHAVALPVGPNGCEGNIPPQYEGNECGELGDVNPLTGGILFSRPGDGLNPAGSGWYYEVAPTDINQVFDTSGNLVPMAPGGTPQASLINSECSTADVVKIQAEHSTSEDITTGFGSGLSVQPSQGPQWTNILSFPQNLNVYNNNYIIGIGPGSDNPSITSTNYTDWIDVGSEMYHYDENGDPCYLYNNLTTSIGSPITCQLGAIDTVQSVQLVPPMTYSPGAGTGIVGTATHPFETLLIEGDPAFQKWTFYDPNDPLYSQNGACPGHGIGPGALGPVGSIPIASCPLCVLPVWKTEFVKTIPPSTSGWSLSGLEWGINDVTTNPSTKAKFGSGWKNTQIIDGYTQSTTPPLYHPTLSTRHVAAEEALKYGVINQHLLEEGEEWFLPSYDEFMQMIAVVGPNGSVWGSSGYLINTAQQDFIDSWNTLSDGMSKNVHWTSSEDDKDSASFFVDPVTATTGLNSNDYAIAVEVTSLAPFSTPLFARRCQSLTVRPIRRYRCPEDTGEQPGPKYNFRDSHHIWVENDQNGGLSGGGRQAHTPFVSIYTPGGSGSGYAWNDSGHIPGYNVPSHQPGYGNGIGGVIGLDNYIMSFAATDIMQNAQEYNISNPHGLMPDGTKRMYNAFTNVKANASAPYDSTDMNGFNTTGLNISIWDNQKNFVGKWHYKYARLITPIWGNKLNWNGYIRDCATHPNPNPGTNCYNDPINGQSMPYPIDHTDFPNQQRIHLSGVTHLAGPHSIFRYGENHEARDRRFWNHFIGVNEIPWSDWHHPYMENAFNGWTASYAYIKVECAYTQSLGPKAFHSINGNNTDIDSVNVVCMRNLFLDTYQGWSPPNKNLNPTTGSLLGVGDESNHSWNNSTSPPGFQNDGGYGWQLNDPTKKGNSAFGDLYGINYRDGLRQETGYGSHSLTYFNSYHPNLSLHPKHWAFIWHAAGAPNSGTLNLYNDLHDGYASCYGYRCYWNLGDIGPAGGIIVAVPGMPGDIVTPDGVAGMNENGWYYEMSSVDLGEPGKDIVFGNYNSWVSYWNDPFINEGTSLNQHGGAKNTSFKYDTPYTILGNGFAATSIETNSLLNMNPPGGPYSPPYNQQNAFILCDQYETFDMYGFKYDDWFLPSIQEMWFACNNLLTAPLSSTGYPFKDLYWTSNEYRDDGPGWPSKTDNAIGPILGNLLPNLTYSTTGGGTMFSPIGINNPDLTRSNAAYAVNVNEKITGVGGAFNANLFPTTKAAYVVYKMGNYKVRAMRRFKCPKWVDPGPPGT